MLNPRPQIAAKRDHLNAVLESLQADKCPILCATIPVTRPIHNFNINVLGADKI